GSVFFLNFFLASVEQDLCAFLNLLLFSVLRDEIPETTNRFFKFFVVHQFDSSLVSLNRTFEVLRSRPFGRSRSGRSGRYCHRTASRFHLRWTSNGSSRPWFCSVSRAIRRSPLPRFRLQT